MDWSHIPGNLVLLSNQRFVFPVRIHRAFVFVFNNVVTWLVLCLRTIAVVATWRMGWRGEKLAQRPNRKVGTERTWGEGKEGESMRNITHCLTHIFIQQALIRRLLYGRCWGSVQSVWKSDYEDLVGNELQWGVEDDLVWGPKEVTSSSRSENIRKGRNRKNMTYVSSLHYSFSVHP